MARPGPSAQTVSGQARAVQATIRTPLGLPTTTSLADTGTLGGANDAREASRDVASISSLLTVESLHASTIGWSDQAASEASLARLVMTVAGTLVSADFVMARALSSSDSGVSAATAIDNLSLGGVPIVVTGGANQTVSFPGGRLIINEQYLSSGGATVNALHLIVTGGADVVIGSATAGVF